MPSEFQMGKVKVTQPATDMRPPVGKDSLLSCSSLGHLQRVYYYIPVIDCTNSEGLQELRVTYLHCIKHASVQSTSIEATPQITIHKKVQQGIFESIDWFRDLHKFHPTTQNPKPNIMHVCLTYVCMFVCMYVCMYVCIYVSTVSHALRTMRFSGLKMVTNQPHNHQSINHYNRRIVVLFS